MQNYFQLTDYILEKIWFDYLGKRYFGRGSMKWNPASGFHIEAVLNTNNQLPHDVLEFGRIGIIGKSNKTSIKMKPYGFDWAISPNVTLYERRDITSFNRLSITLGKVIFCQSEFTNIENSPSYRGTALYKTKSKIRLSDSVCREERLNDKMFKKSYDSGISYEDEDQRVIAHKPDDTHIKLHWTHFKTTWSKSESWKWAEAAQDAFSVWYGETILLLQREFIHNSKRYIEIRINREFYSLGQIYSPLNANRNLDKVAFIKLAKFFTCQNEKAFICRMIFNQILEASRQNNWQITELLIATILEAALRTYDQRPFAEYSDKKDWNVNRSLKNFREQYWSRDWKKVCKKALDTHRNLRHKNAHPDWLFDDTGYLCDEQREKSVDEIIFLSRFYGYMILTLSGAKNLQPNFPVPHKEWGVAYTSYSKT